MIIVSIILLNYNGKNFNKNCIDSILKQDYHDFEIIFVDQRSTDGSLEEVESLYRNEIQNGKIKIMRNTENNGFTGGNNLGITYADNNSKYICLLNNDTVVQKDWLEKMVKSIECDNTLGAVSCLILNKGFEEKEKNQICVKHRKCVSTIFGESVYVNMSKDEINSNFYYTTTLSGCCCMYKKGIIGYPFPQYYFAYAEDLYLSRLIINMGYKLGVTLDTYINHFGSGSFGRTPSKLKLFHGNKNQIINFLVFYPLFYRILLLPLFFIKEFAHLFLGSSYMRLKAKIKSWIWICQNYNKVNLTRNRITHTKKISYYDFIISLTPKLSDSYFVGNFVFKVLIFLGNVLFLIYFYFVKLFISIFHF